MIPAISNKMKLTWEKICRRFSLAEIESATQYFHDELVIGQGGFGKVYRGTFDDGSSAAIKRLDSGSKQGASEFWAEIEMLSCLRHCHLVSLIGYCNDENEMILVYELMPHGSLADHLHRLGTRLSWLQRLRICIGAARGLDYLHTGTGTHHGVIHRDVKSSNILLDDNWEAKISDFGLSKVGPTNQQSTSVSTAIKGSFGYVDPEYQSTGRLTRKSDVYAFGVVLLEVLCGRRAVDKSLDEEQWGLVGWAQDCIKEGKLLQIIDFSLNGQILLSCSSKFSQIALSCLHNRPKERPTMGEVVVDLEFALALQESLDYSEPDIGSTPAKKITFIRKIQKLLFPFVATNSVHGDAKPNVSPDQTAIQSKHAEPPEKVDLPSVLEKPPSSLIVEPDQNENENENEDENDYNMLPAVAGLEICGEAFPGRELLACGYRINGTTLCRFRWVRYPENKLPNFIDGVIGPSYVVTADDVDTCLAVQVVPLDDKQREGYLVKCFANSNRKISCDPEMSRHIERTLIEGKVSYELYLRTGSQDEWKPATLEIKTEGFRIRNIQTNGVGATEKFSPATIVNIQCGSPLEFSISGFGGIVRHLKTESAPPFDVSCSRDTIVITLRLFIKSAVERKKEKRRPDEDEDEDEDADEDDEDADEDENAYNLLPKIEGLQICGEAFPGREIEASGYSMNGTTHCYFQWVRHMEGGSVNYIDGATDPVYVVTADDVDTYLAVEVQPSDDKQRKGKIVKCFASLNRKISRDPEMSNHIERTLIAGKASYKLYLWTGSQDTWKPATLEIKTESFRIRNTETNDIVATEKFSPATVVKIRYESPSEFSIIGFGGIVRHLKTESAPLDVSCSRDTIIITLRLFIKSAVERKKEKRSGSCFYFSM